MKKPTRHERRVAALADLLLEADYRIYCLLRDPDREVIAKANAFVAKLRAASTDQLIRDVKRRRALAKVAE